MNFAEMFSGIGGFRFGLEKTNHIECSHFSEEPQQKDCEQGRKWTLDKRGIQFRSRQNSSLRCVWANDFDKYACQIYRKHYGKKELVEGDIRTINPNNIPDFELLTAGFPCQSFSLAGKRRGFEDTCGTLFYEVARIASIKRPKLLLLENVKGLLSNDEGRTFAKILQTLDELGYLVEWQVLNSKHFGVPQNRERVFIVGHLRGTGSKQIFPIGQASENTDGTCEKAQGERSRFRVANSLNVGGSGRERNLIANTLSNRYYKDGSENLIMLSHTKANIKQREQKRENTWTLDGTSSKQAVILSHSPRTNDPKLGGSGPLISDEHCFTVDSTPHNLIKGMEIRRLTPVECERLQGFPDGWTQTGLTKETKEITVSDTQRYKLLGNAVTTNVIDFLGQKLLEASV